ncbi:MAG: hypothetical protein ACR2PL_23435 [Dehalococcoidia bacterium]
MTIVTFLWESAFSLEIAHKPATRGDIAYVAGCLFRAASCLIQVLFALNGRYLINEKGSVQAVDMLALRPSGFSQSVAAVLAAPGTGAEQLAASVQRFEQLVEEVQMIWVDRSGGEPLKLSRTPMSEGLGVED